MPNAKVKDDTITLVSWDREGGETRSVLLVGVICNVNMTGAAEGGAGREPGPQEIRKSRAR